MTTAITAALLTTVLNSPGAPGLVALLDQSFATWNSWHMQPRPIVGTVGLVVKDRPIDCQAVIGELWFISRDGTTNFVDKMAQQLGLFGIYAGWSCEIGETYVASVN